MEKNSMVPHSRWSQSRGLKWASLVVAKTCRCWVAASWNSIQTFRKRTHCVVGSIMRVEIKRHQTSVPGETKTTTKTSCWWWLFFLGLGVVFRLSGWAFWKHRIVVWVMARKGTTIRLWERWCWYVQRIVFISLVLRNSATKRWSIWKMACTVARNATGSTVTLNIVWCWV